MKDHSFKVGDMVMPKLGVTSSNNNVGVEDLIKAEIIAVYSKSLSIRAIAGVVTYNGKRYPQSYNWTVDIKDFELYEKRPDNYEIY